MSFLSEEEWETVTEPLVEGKVNIFQEPPSTGVGRGNPNKSYLTPGVEDNTAVTRPSSQSAGLVISRLVLIADCIWIHSRLSRVPFLATPVK